MKNVLILGANSGIAKCYARLLVGQKAHLIIVGRDEAKLKTLEDDLRARGAGKVVAIASDLADDTRHIELWQKILSLTPEHPITEVLIAYGSLPDAKKSETDYALQKQTYMTNTLSVMSWCTLIANYFTSQKKGQLSVISSVAGDVGRKSNYVYGSAKAALSTYLQGLRGRLFPLNIKVLTIKPGFVDTPMVASLKKNALYASPEKVAKGILRATRKGQDVAYLPGFWYFILLILRHLPESLIKRLNF